MNATATKIRKSAKMDELVGEVRRHAMANYDSGWDVVVEALSDEDIAEAIGSARTPAGAIGKLRSVVNLHLEQTANVAEAAPKAKAPKAKAAPKVDGRKGNRDQAAATKAAKAPKAPRPMGRLASHLREAFADQPVGGFLSLAQIRDFRSAAFPADDKRPVVSNLVKALVAASCPAEVAPGRGGPKDVHGATRV